MVNYINLTYNISKTYKKHDKSYGQSVHNMKTSVMLKAYLEEDGQHQKYPFLL